MKANSFISTIAGVGLAVAATGSAYADDVAKPSIMIATVNDLEMIPLPRSNPFPTEWISGLVVRIVDKSWLISDQSPIALEMSKDWLPIKPFCGPVAVTDRLIVNGKITDQPGEGNRAVIAILKASWQIVHLLWMPQPCPPPDEDPAILDYPRR